MKEYQILIKDHGLEAGPLWLCNYKVVKFGQFITNLSEDRYDAGYFEEDDYIIELCKNKFLDLEIIEVQENIIKIKEETNELVV